MGADIFSMLARSMAACISFFDLIIESLDLVGFVLSAFLIYTVCRFLLVPLLGGSGGSDKARKKKDGGDG